jgi:hypothetical protein
VDRRTAESRANQVEQRAESERERANRAEQGRDGERARADALRDRLDALQAQLTTMEAEGAESDVAVAQLTAQLKEARLHAEGVLHAAETRHGELAADDQHDLLARIRAAWR